MKLKTKNPLLSYEIKISSMLMDYLNQLTKQGKITVKESFLLGKKYGLMSKLNTNR